jgi:CRISPR/Cas system CSM-associated protein Csm4 (group 5 of RAMP superfamily)
LFLIFVFLKKNKLKSTSYIKCSSCGTFNKNLENCEQCGALINPETILKHKIEERKQKQVKQLNKEKLETEDSFIYKMRNHRFLLIRVMGAFFYSVWVIVMAVGSFLAWLAAAISA